MGRKKGNARLFAEYVPVFLLAGFVRLLPFSAAISFCGLFGRPTIVNNTETVANILIS